MQAFWGCSGIVEAAEPGDGGCGGPGRDETSFTSYGPTVVLDADGYQVESFVPGGKRMKESGTSMASPNVANLAAKLIAIDPKLTPEQTLDVMEKTATASADGRMHLINPKAAVAMVEGMAGR